MESTENTEIDEWLRRRIRMCFWKQWRYVRTKVRNLLRLGTYKKEVILTALSRKGPWHSAGILATQAGMTNKQIIGARPPLFVAGTHSINHSMLRQSRITKIVLCP